MSFYPYHEKTNGIMTLNDHLKFDYSLRRVRVAADGNCQFRALALFFPTSNISHLTIRHQVVQYIRENKETFKDEIEALKLEDGIRSVDHYCSLMSQPGYWGDYTTLQAFSLLYNVNVWLFTNEGAKPLRDEDEQLQNIGLVHQHSHFDAALPLL